MSTLNQGAENTVLAALIAGLWSGIIIDKLAAFTLRLNMPVLHVVAQWWPVLLIIAGLVVLFRHKNQQRMAAPARQVLVMPRQQHQVITMERKEQSHAR
jgi:hypothetical protein